MSVLRDALAQVFIQFVRNGVIAPGLGTRLKHLVTPKHSARTFRKLVGTFTVCRLLNRLREREQRIAPVIQGACKRAGAIHEADILIVVEE